MVKMSMPHYLIATYLSELRAIQAGRLGKPNQYNPRCFVEVVSDQSMGGVDDLPDDSQ